jgi:hypothetical protein
LIIFVTAVFDAELAPVTANVTVLDPTDTETPAFAEIVDSNEFAVSQTDTFNELPIAPGYFAAYRVSESAAKSPLSSFVL